MATQDAARAHRAGAAPLAGTGFVSVGANVRGEQIIMQTNFSTCELGTVTPFLQVSLGIADVVASRAHDVRATSAYARSSGVQPAIRPHSSGG